MRREFMEWCPEASLFPRLLCEDTWRRRRPHRETRGGTGVPGDEEGNVFYHRASSSLSRLVFQAVTKVELKWVS